jgi:membrane-associated phospholipid phosphatase
MLNLPTQRLKKSLMKYAAIIVFGLVFFSQVHAQNLDIDWLKEINLNRNQSLDPSFRLVTNSVTPLVIAVPTYFLANALIKKDSVSKGRAIIISSSLILSGIISTSLKYAVQRERPYDEYPFIQKETSGGGYSFPSGHTSAAFSLATSLSIVYPKWYVIAPSFLWASTVGYSRMDLGVHYPSDVLAGALIGSGSAFLSYKLNKWISGKGKTRTSKR